MTCWTHASKPGNTTPLYLNSLDLKLRETASSACSTSYALPNRCNVPAKEMMVSVLCLHAPPVGHIRMIWDEAYDVKRCYDCCWITTNTEAPSGTLEEMRKCLQLEKGLSKWESLLSERVQDKARHRAFRQRR